MLRRLQVVSNKNADATFKASADIVRGGVVKKDYANGVIETVSATPTSTSGLFFVDRGQYPTGLATLEGELSDYDARYETIKSGEYVVLEKPLSGEVYGTTQFDDTDLSVGDALTVDATGQFVKSASATGFVYRGTLADNGHTLAVVEVL